jgi:prolyl-tRNA synthetase
VITEGEKVPSFNISWTHEEIIAEIAAKRVSSHKDLPLAVYQVQTKFRHEPRAKSGLLRGREFLMKDLYSFHASEEDLNSYYKKVAEAYQKIFKRCGLRSIYTLAAGGEFTSNYTHEFQVVTDVGEDTIYVCEGCGYAENKEISKLKVEDRCPKCGGRVQEKKSIEVGNIFPLGTKYSEAFNLHFTDEYGEKKLVVMGSYGIGLGRVMGTIAEIYHDKLGIIRPEAVAPYRVHLIELQSSKSKSIKKQAEELYKNLLVKGVEVLYDERDDKTAGEKFADADLIGIPWRAVISQKTFEKKGIEIKRRDSPKSEIISLKEFLKRLC